MASLAITDAPSGSAQPLDAAPKTQRNRQRVPRRCDGWL